MNLKGVVLAGGTGSRLMPLTKVTNKHLLPIGHKPMIYYPIEKLTSAGIKEILIVTGVDHMGDVVNLLGSGKDFGCRFTYKVQDEAGHGQLLYRAAETLGISREEMIEALLSGQAKYSNIFNYPAVTWADAGMIGWLVDAAAIVNQLMLAEGSYGPYARAMKRICYEESFHLKQGHHFVVTLAGGTRRQRDMVQAALNRWWWPTLQMFGPSDKDSVHLQKMMRWKIKTRTNDELRYDFVAQYAPQILRLGLTIPDPELHYDEREKRWHFGEPDWEEFRRVISGQGPMNAERLAVRRAAHEEGRWVREALAAKSLSN